ncbi:MAG: hypothetical protein ABIH83_03880 [Candidatus Micrarchaeota archaeon]
MKQQINLKKAQATFEFLANFLILLFILTIFSAAATNLLSTSTNSIQTIHAKNQLSILSLNLGILYSSTNQTTINSNPLPPDTKLQENLLSFQQTIVFTINPGVKKHAQISSTPN